MDFDAMRGGDFNANRGASGMMSRSLFAAVFTAMCALAPRADALAVKMLPGECWWGVCNSFGTNMPFTAATQGFKADLFAWDDVGPGPKKSFIFTAIMPRFCDISAESVGGQSPQRLHG